MAQFSLRNLSVLAYANGFTLWHYKSVDLKSAHAPQHFKDAADLVATGDMILVTGPEGGTVSSVIKSPNNMDIKLISLTGDAARVEAFAS